MTTMADLQQMQSAVSQLIGPINNLTKALAPMAKAVDSVKDSVKEVDKETNKAAGGFGILADKVNKFMTSQKQSTRFMRRIAYSLGLFRPINLIATSLETVDRVFGSIIKKDSLLGKLTGRFTKMAVGVGKLGKSFVGSTFTEDLNKLRKGLALGFTKIDPKQRAANKEQREGEPPLIMKFYNKQIAFMEKIGGGVGNFFGKDGPFRKGFASIMQLVYAGLKFMIFSMLTITGIVLIAKAFGPQIKSAIGTIIDTVKPLFEFLFAEDGPLRQIWAGISSIFSAIFGGGSLGDALGGVIQISFGLLRILWAVAITIVKGLWEAGKTFLKETYEKAKEYAKTKFSELTGPMKFVVKVLGVILLAGLLILGLPVLIPLILIAFGLFVIDKLVGALDFFAAGGVSGGGMAVVGEEGPELVSLPAGARVHSNATSRSMVTGGKTVNNFNITINANDTSDAEMRRIADKIAGMIDTRVKRRSSMG